MSVLLQANRIVLVDRNAGAFEHAMADRRPASPQLRLEIVPPVVIAEYRVHPQRRAQGAQRFRPRLRRHALDLKAMAGGEIAEQHDEIGPQRIGALGNGGNTSCRHQRLTRVNIGQHGDGQLEAFRPPRRRDLVARHAEAPHGLHSQGIATERQRRCRRRPEARQNPPAREKGSPHFRFHALQDPHFANAAIRCPSIAANASQTPKAD